MAEIISISLTKEILEELETIQNNMNFKGRSEILRAGLRSLIEEHKKLLQIKGNCEGTIIATHKETNTDEFSKLKHKFHNLVKTHIHHELENHSCMEIMLFKGNATFVKEFYEKLVSSKKIDMVKVVVS